MAARRSALSLLRVAAAPSATRCASSLSLPCSTAALLARRSAAPACVNGIQNTAGTRRWYSAETDPDAIPGSRSWSASEIKDELARVKSGKDSDVVFVDVREPSELHATGKIPRAVNIPVTTAIQSFHVAPEDFEAMFGFPRPPKDKELVFYCKAGVRAKAAAGLARHAGWERVGVYRGSWLDWEKEQGEVQRVREGEESD